MIKKVLQVLIVLIMLAVFVRGMIYIFGSGEKSNKEYIAVLDVNGVIVDADNIINHMTKLNKDKNVKGFILKVNSPGGLVAPSQHIYQFLTTIEKPLYVAMGSTAASGGYMISLPADKIYAMPGTTTGSIGVIMQIPNFKKLQEKIGIDTVVIKSGKFKDIGNSSRDMTDDEKQVLSSMIMDMYEQFVTEVSKSRNMPLAEVKRLADGRIYTGKMAKEAGLVDELGSWQDAFDALKKELQLPDIEYVNIDTRKLSNFEKFFNKLGIPLPVGSEQVFAKGFYYLMD